MTFPDALYETFQNNARITRRHWANRSIYVSVIDARLCITGYSSTEDDDPRPHPLVITESDYFADDWEVVE